MKVNEYQNLAARTIKKGCGHIEAEYHALRAGHITVSGGNDIAGSCGNPFPQLPFAGGFQHYPRARFQSAIDMAICSGVMGSSRCQTPVAR